MLRPVWLDRNFWYFLGLNLTLHSSYSWVFSSLEMEFMKKTTGLVAFFLTSTLVLSWISINFLVMKLSLASLDIPRTEYRLLHGYERVGRIVGSALLFLGNIGLYYSPEKSVACMLTFLFLAFYCLGALFYIRPCTDFGVLNFLLSASLNLALSLFGYRFYSWLVLMACVVIAGLRYWLERDQVPKEEKGFTSPTLQEMVNKETIGLPG